MNCRFCRTPLPAPFVSLGCTPLANSFLGAEQLERMEPHFPLSLFLCPRCYLVQLPEMESPASIFSHYAYFSSYSDTWQSHCEAYAERMTRKLRLGSSSRVVEIASNDGCLLARFASRGVPVLGIEPARNVAEFARQKGIPTESIFFGAEAAERLWAEGRGADLLVANNVLAHVPGLVDFVAGMKRLLKPGGTLTVEFPHLLRLLEEVQFDTIYHEHFSYFSLHFAQELFAASGLGLFDVEELPVHGGSLRLFLGHAGEPGREASGSVGEILEREVSAGLRGPARYARFAQEVRAVKRRLLAFLIQAQEEGKRVAAYGAPAKGNTLLNACGVGVDFIDFTVDRNPHKQGLFLPGSHLPILAPEAVSERRPDYLLILPWNIRGEVMEQMKGIREWGGKFVVPIPQFEVLS